MVYVLTGCKSRLLLLNGLAAFPLLTFARTSLNFLDNQTSVFQSKKLRNFLNIFSLMLAFGLKLSEPAIFSN